MVGGARKRIQQHVISLSGGGGGGPAPTGNFEVGPSFGQSAGNDATTLNALATLDLAEINMAGGVASNVAIDLDSINLAGGVGASAALDLASVDLGGALGTNIAIATSIAIASQPQEDTYLDRANGTTANGSATVLSAQNNTAVVNDDENTYIAWDLTGFTTGTVSSAEIDLYMSENLLVGGLDANIEIYTNASKPFEESTATWNADEQPAGTLRQTITENIDGATLTLHTLTLDATSRANMLGNWVYVRVTGPSSGLDTTTVISTGSKENAGNEPELRFTI